VAYNSD